MKSNLIKSIFKLFIPAIVFMQMVQACSDEKSEPPGDVMNYRGYMRSFVEDISSYAKDIKPGFVVIPQNGIELVSVEGDFTSYPETKYLAAIDGVGQEDLFYGYDNDDEPTPDETSQYLIHYLDIAKENDVTVLVTDYCSTHSKMDDSYQKNGTKGYVSFAASHRGLDNMPDYPATPINENNETITQLSQVKNFLYLIDPVQFASKEDFINAVTATNYDLLIMDCFFNDESFTPAETAQLKQKANGGKRLVVSYMSIGEAENYRYYWQSGWLANPPGWLKEENPDWEGNFKVAYWDKEWQDIIFGNDSSYAKKIIDAGFDGVYLDIIDAFEYFEE